VPPASENADVAPLSMKKSVNDSSWVCCINGSHACLDVAAVLFDYAGEFRKDRWEPLLELGI
jgi:hypothetical protein